MTFLSTFVTFLNAPINKNWKFHQTLYFKYSLKNLPIHYLPHLCRGFRRENAILVSSSRMNEASF